MRQTGGSVSPMSNEGRNVYVIEHLMNACLLLLRNKTLDNISISELCNTACVGRASFYRNFENKEDIIKTYVNRLFSEWISEYEQSDDKPIDELILLLFSHFEKHRDFYSLLNERGLIYLLKDVIVKISGLKQGLPKIEAYSKAFLAYSLYGWTETWFQRGMEESAEEMAGLFKMQGIY